MIMAGGTGGHVFPALAVAKELMARGCEVSWLGTPNSFESRVVPDNNIAFDTIAAHRLRGQNKLSLLLAPLHLLHAMWQAAGVLRRRRPQVLLGMGGFASGPGGLVGRLMGTPLVVHEQNTIPGMTNRWLARMASRVLEAFPNAFPNNARAKLCGNPVREDILALPAPHTRGVAESPRLRLLVMGGSLGARALNELLPQAMALMPADERPLLRHQAGRGNQATTKQAYAEAGVDAQVDEFIDDMPEAYGSADLIICRAGALTISELAAAGVASVLVPFPYAVDDHQTHNAAYLVEAKAAYLIQQRDMTAASLSALLGQLLSDRKELLAMAKRAYALAAPKATVCVANVCMEVVA